jgi:UDP-N-acetylglucosamine 2-epimerase
MTAQQNPYGDGRAAARIASVIEQVIAGKPPAPVPV